MILPSAYEAPRLTTSQHAMPTERGSGCGRYSHSSAPFFVRSSAIRLFGYGVTTYIVEPTTSGLPSWPCGTPVITVDVLCRPLTFCAVSCASGEYRVFARAPAGSVHWPFGSGETVVICAGSAGAPAGG